MTAQTTINAALASRGLMTLEEREQEERDLADAGEYASFTLTREDPADDGACVACGWNEAPRLRMNNGLYRLCCVFCGEVVR